MKTNVIRNNWPKLSLATLIAVLLLTTDSQSDHYKSMVAAHRLSPASPYEFKI